MTTAADVGWGKYKGYRGPFFRGTKRFKLPDNPTVDHQFLAVTTATEGGSPDAINMYDRCMVSTSYIQNCELYFMTSRLLGEFAKSSPDLLQPLTPVLQASEAVFSQTARGRWRFIFLDERGEVDTRTEQQQLFLLNSTGKVGTWDDESKEHAKHWAACLANTFAQEETEDIQVAFSARRLRAYVLPGARRSLFSDQLMPTGWVGAVQAGFLSYAVNIPAQAEKWLTEALKDAPGPKWSRDWSIHLFKTLTFGPKVAIWPHRYNAIRPTLEKLFGVDMPDFADELAKWEDEMDQGVERDGIDPAFHQLGEIQQVLIDMGYDLGPAKADGVMGRKTRDAIMTFQGLNGLVADGIVGSKTRAKLLEVWRAQVCA
jgi:hypothetical protein